MQTGTKRQQWLMGFLLGAAQLGCATVDAVHAPVDVAATAPHIDVSAVRARIAKGQSAINHLRADVRLVSFGPQGRLRGRAEIYVRRPNQIRYTLLGPQGGPLVVLACDGETLRGLDMQQRRFVTGAADAEQFDAWLAPLHLRMDAHGWVRVLFGELEVPADAVSAGGAPAGSVALRWHMADGQRVWAAFDRNDARLRSVRLCRGDVVDTTLDIERRDSQGLPERIRIEHTKPGSDGVHQIELSLRDVDVTTAQQSDIYSLMPPDGFAIIAPQSAHK